LCIAIFGARGERAERYAHELGLALQLTNILRDLDEDAARGRLYLPLEDLASFGVAESDLLAGRRTPAVLRVLRFEARRARVHFLRARASIGAAERASLLPAEVMADVYEALLDAMEAAGFPRRRVALSGARQAAIALRCYARQKVRIP
jgi:phytoene synthase